MTAGVLWGFVKKELTQAVRDPRMKMILFVMPAVQMFLFGVAISDEVKNIRLAATFDSRDTVLRHIYERAIAGKWFIPARVPRGGRGGPAALDPFELVRSGQADAVLVPPPGGLTRALGRGTAPLQLLIDSTNVNQARAVDGYLEGIVRDVLKADWGFSPPPPPVELDMRVLFNPSLSTAYFLVPGVMALIMALSTFILTILGIAREKELGTFEMLVSAPLSRTELILGKTLPPVLLGLTSLPLILGIAVLVFQVPVRGSVVAILIATFLFVSAVAAAGTMASTFCKNQQQAAMGSFLFLYPAIMFSGLIFPIENMPWALRWLGAVDPMAHYLSLLRNIMLKGGDPGAVGRHLAALFIISAAAVAWSFRRFRTTLD